MTVLRMIAAVSLIALFINASEPLQAERPERMAVTGILQRQNGTVPADEKVYLAYVTDQGSFVRLGMVDGNIQPVNPSGKVSKKGRFRIEFDAAFLKDALDKLKTKRFTMGIMNKLNGQFMPISTTDAKTGIFFELPDLFGEKSQIDLGTIIWEND